MRRELGVIIVVSLIAVLAAYRIDDRVKLFPRMVSPTDRIMASVLLRDWGIEYEYDSSTDRIFLTEPDRAEVLPCLVQFGLPSEPSYQSRVDSGGDTDFQATLVSMLRSSSVEWKRAASGRAALAIRSSWAVGPAEISSLYRLLALYYPSLELDKVDFELEVGTDLLAEDLVRYGRTSFNESIQRKKAVQAALSYLLPAKSACLVHVTYGPPPPFEEDDIDDGDFSRYMMSESVRIELFFDRHRVDKAEAEELSKFVTNPGRLIEDRGDSVIVHHTVWAKWQSDLARESRLDIQSGGESESASCPYCPIPECPDGVLKREPVGGHPHPCPYGCVPCPNDRGQIYGKTHGLFGE